MTLPSEHPITQIRCAYSLEKEVKNLLREKKIWDGSFPEVADVFRRGPSIFLRVYSHLDADKMVRRRSGLRGSGISVLDVLSPPEAAQHAALQPRYDAAIVEGKRAQFTRSRLKIDGKWV